MNRPTNLQILAVILVMILSIVVISLSCYNIVQMLYPKNEVKSDQYQWNSGVMYGALAIQSMQEQGESTKDFDDVLKRANELKSESERGER